MKTPVEELFEKLWNTDKDKLAWNAILEEALEKEKEFILNSLSPNMHAYSVLVAIWAAHKGLSKRSDGSKQMLKVTEEIGELAAALARKDKEATIDAIGDSFVTLIILAHQLGLNPTRCLEAAWEEIKDRTGKIENGVFIKDGI